VFKVVKHYFIKNQVITFKVISMIVCVKNEKVINLLKIISHSSLHVHLD